jgi:exopolyphosphatase/guanosine-5'-triphosphate,3'-diphosphate pyrophosphatase
MTVAAIDIGTNSVRMLITDAAGAQLDRRMQITRLGQGVDVDGRLADEAIARTVSVLQEYGRALQGREVQRVRITATSAARDAGNSEAFFDAVEAATGHRPELLPGEEEAALSFQGATADLNPADGPFLVVDIGGGSTEFVLGSTAPEQLISVNMGCVRMTERFLTSDPASRDQQDACLAEVSRILEDVSARVDVPRARRLMGLAGTVTTLACMHKGLDRYDPAQTHGMRLTRADVEDLCTRLASADLDARRQLLLEPKRAEVIVGGALVLVQILRSFDIAELQVSENDILDGLAASLR